MGKQLELAISSIEKQFNKGSIVRLGDHDHVPIDTISTGCLSFDLALGVGGFPRGRVCEIYGQEASGKTTVCLHLIANAQKSGGIGAIIDAEHALDPIYAKNLGVDTDNLLVSQPDYGEQALEIADALVKSGEVDIIVVDSVAALIPKNELDGNYGDAQMGLQARMMSQAMRKLTSAVHKSNCCLVFINQLRSKIGIVFGNPEVTTGGNALKFYSSVRCDVRRIAQIKDGDNVVGSRTRVKIIKNKLSAPYKEAEFDILYGKGISRFGDIIDIASDQGIVQKSGSWFSYGSERIGQGKSNVVEYLESNPEIADKLEAEIRAKLGLKEK